MDIAVHQYEKNTNLGMKSFECVELLYLSFLKKVKILGVTKVNIFLTHAAELDGKIEIFGNYISYYKHINSNVVSNLLDCDQTKRVQLDIITDAIVSLSKAKGWPADMTQLFLEAKIKCLESGLVYKWFFKKKFIKSPNGNFYFGLLHELDLDDYKIYEILYDKKRIEIFRRIIFKDKHIGFAIDNASWLDTENFSYSFHGPKKIFQTNIKELIEKTEKEFPKNPSDYFK